MVIGYIAVSEIERSEGPKKWLWVVAPWLPILVSAGITWLLNWEGVICVVLALPIALFFSSIGGLIAHLAARYRRKLNRGTLAGIAMLPVLIAPLEMQAPRPRQIRTADTEIEIPATTQTVWNNIERVRTIGLWDLKPAWTRVIGFPRPIAATLSYEGVGGVRHASFEHG